MPEWPTSAQTEDTEVREQLAQVFNQLEIVSESYAALALAAEDQGWVRLGEQAEREFDRNGLDAIARNCRVMAVASPLIKRGLAVRAGYIWGGGVAVDARDPEVAEVVSDFWTDESNQAAFTSSQAQEENERVLGTDGNFFLALFTNRLTGRVQVRSTPFAEVRDVILNPEDRDDPWFYLREWTTTTFGTGSNGLTQSSTTTAKALHPALGYRPRVRPKSIDGILVEWDTPMVHVPVNRLDGTKWGIPDAYSSLPWARAYEGFLTDWAKLVKSLSRFAWRLSGDKASKAQKAARTIAGAIPTAITAAAGTSDAGAAAAYGPGAHLEAIPKSGATIDSESGKPLASMAAAGLGLPVTMLLADPGTTGARAVAETLDRPTQNEMGMRRSLWGSLIETVTGYVIDQAVRAPQGSLRGLVVWDRYTDREVITLAPVEDGVDRDRSVTVTWPDFDSDDLATRVAAIVDAHSTNTIPPREVARLLLLALEVDDVDELLEPLFDDDGQYAEGKEPAASAGAAALRGFERGETGSGEPLDDDA